jgi:hypothetical protein
MTLAARARPGLSLMCCILLVGCVNVFPSPPPGLLQEVSNRLVPPRPAVPDEASVPPPHQAPDPGPRISHTPRPEPAAPNSLSPLPASCELINLHAIDDLESYAQDITSKPAAGNVLARAEHGLRMVLYNDNCSYTAMYLAATHLGLAMLLRSQPVAAALQFAAAAKLGPEKDNWAFRLAQVIEACTPTDGSYDRLARALILLQNGHMSEAAFWLQGITRDARCQRLLDLPNNLISNDLRTGPGGRQNI